MSGERALDACTPPWSMLATGRYHSPTVAAADNEDKLDLRVELQYGRPASGGRQVLLHGPLPPTNYRSASFPCQKGTFVS
jgi:hypothetical protein